MADFGIKHIQIKLDAGEYDLLKDKARGERMNITPYARQLLLAALNGDKEEISISSREWCKMLENILTKGSKDECEWITGTLKTFTKVIEARG
jgi:hypothetical protein